MHDRIWETRQGTLIPVSRMRTDHIWHCLRMMDRARARGRRFREEYRDRLLLELYLRDLGLHEHIWERWYE